MVKKHNTDKADKEIVEQLQEDYKENSTPLEKFRFFKDKLAADIKDMDQIMNQQFMKFKKEHTN